eukprot:1083455-Pyramimonas_sp.AAC.1
MDSERFQRPTITSGDFQWNGSQVQHARCEQPCLSKSLRPVGAGHLGRFLKGPDLRGDQLDNYRRPHQTSSAHRGLQDGISSEDFQRSKALITKNTVYAYCDRSWA